MSNADNDEKLALRACAGDRAAFGALLEHHYPSVLALCRRLLGVGAEAEDVAQETALSALISLGQLREPGRFGAWLHAIAANLARMALRRRQPLPLPVPDAAGTVLLWSAGPPAPEEVAATRELHDTVVAALAELSPLSREAVIGFYLQGYSYAELAAILNVPVGTLKGRLVFGRRQLRGRLGHLNGAAPAPDHSSMPPQRTKEPAMSASEPVLVTIDSVRLHTVSNHRLIVLREADGERQLPIWIGPSEADAISSALQGQTFPRPMTHDLSLNLLHPLGVSLRRVTITQIVDNVFFAAIELAGGEHSYSVDARPSDALALAVRASTPIYVAPEVLAAAGFEELADTAPLRPGAPRPEAIPLLFAGRSAELRMALATAAVSTMIGSELLESEQDEEALLALAGEPRGALVCIDLERGEAGRLGRLAELHAANPNNPLIALGPDDDEVEASARGAGAGWYLRKPAELAAIRQAISDAVVQLHRRSIRQSGV